MLVVILALFVGRMRLLRRRGLGLVSRRQRLVRLSRRRRRRRVLAVLLALRRRLRLFSWRGLRLVSRWQGLVGLGRRRRRRMLVVLLTPLWRRLGLVSRQGQRLVGCRLSQSRRRRVVVVLQIGNQHWEWEYSCNEAEDTHHHSAAPRQPKQGLPASKLRPERRPSC